MKDPGMVVYEGPSLFTGDPLVVVVTGLTGHTKNQKTGPMLQAWVLRSDVRPMDAKRQNLDDAVCGDCSLRGRDGINSTCYVTVWFGPSNVFKAYHAATYARPTDVEIRRLVAGKRVRVTAYGDPAAVPVEVWQNMLTTADGWVGYSHQWRTADLRLRWLLMASVESPDEAREAQALGWRTFRVRGDADPLLARETVCPASHEGGQRTTCEHCQLCRGRSRGARSIAIMAHGKPGNVAAFYRNRVEAGA